MAEHIIQELAKGQASQTEIARRLQVTATIVRNIWTGHTWTDLERPWLAGTYYNDWRKVQGIKP